MALSGTSVTISSFGAVGSDGMGTFYRRRIGFLTGLD
jgi:hypothetical protein